MMRALRVFIRDRGNVMPLIVLLMQLVLLQAGAVAYSTGAMAGTGSDTGVWCAGLGADTGEGAPVDQSRCMCAAFCAMHTVAGTMLAPAAAVLTLGRVVEAPTLGAHPATHPVLSRAPPRRPGSTRAPPHI